MAKENEEVKVEKTAEITADNDKPTKTEVEVSKETTVAPTKDETMEGKETEAPDVEDIDDALMLLNIMDKEVGGKGEIAEIPEAMRNSIKYLVEKLVFVRDLFEDPQWKALLDDLADQKEDGTTPSVEVAIARTIPLEKLQELADNEEYEAAQMEVAGNLATAKQAEEEDAMYDLNFQNSKKAGEEYAAEMGYDENEKNVLFQYMLDIYKLLSDGKLTKAEWKRVDEMRNYGPHTSDLRAQLEGQPAKEQLPDQASVESAIIEAKTKKKEKPRNTPGMGSIQYDDYSEDITQVGKRKRVK